MTEIIRRRRRKADTSDPFTQLSTESSPLPNSESNTNTASSPNPEITPQDREQSTVSSLSANIQHQQDGIRAELIEDAYHSDWGESNYWDGTHSRSTSEIEPESEDYWNYLGSFE